MHTVYDFRQCKARVGKEFGEFVSRIGLYPVHGGPPGDVLADFGEILGSK